MKKNRILRGQSMVEFALVLPLLLLLVIVFIDLGRIIYIYSALNNAVREGSRYAIVNKFPSSTQRELDVRQKVMGYAISIPIVLNDISIYCDQDQTDLNNPCDQYVTVSAHIEVEPMTALLTRIIGIGNTYSITARSTMQMTPYGQ